MKIRFKNSLQVANGQLVPRGGEEVHAAAFLHTRELLLDSSLLEDAGELIRIFAHEIFHFVWRRLDNSTRASWERLVRAERRVRVKGELGWSAEMRKLKLKTTTGRAWKDYICESFCDTAAWYFSGGRAHEEFTLPISARRARKRWFDNLIEKRRLPI
jgi:hypothetical protein